MEENGFDDVQLNLTDQFDGLHIGQSTPKKTKRSGSLKGGVGRGVCEEVRRGGGGEVVEVRSVSVKKDLQALLKLATDLQVSSLKTK